MFFAYRVALHWPARADHLEDMEQDLNKAARLSRALWIALSNDDLGAKDTRNRSLRRGRFCPISGRFAALPRERAEDICRFSD
jgi:hypothetical protein